MDGKRLKTKIIIPNGMELKFFSINLSDIEFFKNPKANSEGGGDQLMILKSKSYSLSASLKLEQVYSHLKKFFFHKDTKPLMGIGAGRR